MLSSCRLAAFSPLLLLALGFIGLIILDLCCADIHGDVIPTRAASEAATPPSPAANDEVEVDNSVVIEMTEDNAYIIQQKYDFILILFYVDWCRFSVAMISLLEDAVIELAKLLPEPRKYAITKINCDNFEQLCERYLIVKYPTVKVVRYGAVEKLEYRGERSVEALVNYVKEELRDPTIVAYDEQRALHVEPNSRKVIGYLTKGAHEEEEHSFRKVAAHFKNACKFILVYKDTLEQNKPRILFHPDPKSPEIEAAEMEINGTFSFLDLRDWTNFKCVPYVREITFKNAEELTEEGLPLLILFYDPLDSTELIKAFRHLVSTHFMDYIIQRKMNFVTADGFLFQHPLHHMDKTVNDLPLIAIDSLKHLFTYPYHERENILNLEKLHRFLNDFFSEKLHMKFHGLIIKEDAEKETDLPENWVPDNRTPEEQIPLPKKVVVGGDEGNQGQSLRDGDASDEKAVKDKVRDSMFVKLYPSELRYTLKRPIRDEL